MTIKEKPAPKEIIQKGEPLFLWHPGTEAIFSGYGLTLYDGRKDWLVGLLMVDRPQPVDPEWLKAVEATYGDYQLVAMTTGGERGIVCQICVEEQSLSYLRQFESPLAEAIQRALFPLLEKKPGPKLAVHWDSRLRLWVSRFI